MNVTDFHNGKNEGFPLTVNINIDKIRSKLIRRFFSEGWFVMALEKEQEAFNREFSRLVAESQGKYALVFGDKVIAVFDTFQDAVKSGYDRFKLEPFMVKQIMAMERVHRFTRNIAPCHT